MFRKILIANRGEIAVRICRSARDLHIPTLAIYAEDDQHSLHRTSADESVSLGSGTLGDTYLNIDKILGIAENSGCDAIHPGYGFLSENPAFVKACEARNIVFIGPTSETISLMGNKIAARQFAQEAGLPVTEGFSGTQHEILNQADSLTYPLLINAAAGGGGKGMRIVNRSAELQQAIQATSREAASYFGDDAVYVEQFLESPRHIEVQILGDHAGQVVHLYERECSLQRRYQKIIEEAPSTTLTPEVRREICAAAVKLAKAVPYTNAGTIEFLLDKNQQFYFLEMNTRIQVEHPVTEMTTGIDLVAEQIRIAAGKPLSFSQEDIVQKGHAIECRIYAESPENNFLPSPGDISFYHAPAGNQLRIDSYINGPITIHSNYDPMIAKLICYSSDREKARQASIQALKHMAIHGIDTNVHYLSALLKSEDYVQNLISTKYCDQQSSQILDAMQIEKSEFDKLTVVAAGLSHGLDTTQKVSYPEESIWQEIGFWRLLPQVKVSLEDWEAAVEIWKISEGNYSLRWKNSVATLNLEHKKDGKIVYKLDNNSFTAYVSEKEDRSLLISVEGMQFHFRRHDRLTESQHIVEDAELGSADQLKSPMPGKVIQLHVKEGDQVRKGDVLLVVEAMKMENNIVAQRDATVEKLHVALNSTVERNMPLIKLV